MTCAERRAELAAYLDDELGAAERSELETHLVGCADCRLALESERRLSGALGSLPAMEPAANFEARFWARIAREQEAPAGLFARFLSRRLALALGGMATAAVAALLLLRNGVEAGTDWPIVANSRDLELLEDPDWELIQVVDQLEALEGDQG